MLYFSSTLSLVSVRQHPGALLRAGHSRPALAQSNDTHLQRPYSPDPYLELALDSFDMVQLNPLPPASPRRFSPEQKKLLRHAHGTRAHVVASDVAAQAGQGQAADDGLVWFSSSVTPSVVMVEPAGSPKLLC